MTLKEYLEQLGTLAQLTYDTSQALQVETSQITSHFTVLAFYAKLTQR